MVNIGRKYSQWRTAAYECKIASSGYPIKGKLILGRYGLFESEKEWIMQKLSEHAAQGAHYPFLIVEYRLESKAKANKPEKPAKEIKSQDIIFDPRPKIPSTEQWVAVVSSLTDCKLLNNGKFPTDK
jgi:hypothetical protein